MDIDELRLPSGIHAAELSARDVVTGSQLDRIVVWADRTSAVCPRCGQSAEAEVGCPVTLNPGAGQGGRLEEWSQQHGCGQWLSVSWETAASVEDIAQVASQLAERRRTELAGLAVAIERRLRTDLAAALARLAEPLDEGEDLEDRYEEVITGSEVEPGVHREYDVWTAWDYDPRTTGDTITITADDLVAERHAELAEQLRADVGTVASALDALLGVTDLGSLARVQQLADLWAAQILGDDDRLAAQTVIDVMCVVGHDQEQPAEWWQSPLGRAVARSVGHPGSDIVSTSVAAAMLGVSRQAVHKALRAGRLAKGTDGGVTTASIQKLLTRA